MSEFILQPAVYTTGSSQNLLQLLEKMWIIENRTDINYNIFSGFGNYNMKKRMGLLFCVFVCGAALFLNGCRSFMSRVAETATELNSETPPNYIEFSPDLVAYVQDDIEMLISRYNTHSGFNPWSWTVA
jgi:hypothetical protein